MVKQKRNKKGFTLVELVIVLAILAILTAIAIPTVSNITESANVSVDKSNAQSVEMALKAAYSEAKTGIWDVEHDSTLTNKSLNTVTVSEALIHEGFKNGLPEIKGKGTDVSYRARNEKITISKDSIDGMAFTGEKDLKSVMENTAAG